MRHANLASVFLACGMALVMAPGASAQDAAAVVKQRQDLMVNMWPNYYQQFTAVARGQSTDVAAIPAKAQEAAASLRRFGTLFPPGTGRDAVPTARSTPEVWSDRADFDAKLGKLVQETEALGEAAKGGNIEAVKTQFAAVSQACGGCHGGPAKSGGKFRVEVP